MQWQSSGAIYHETGVGSRGSSRGCRRQERAAGRIQQARTDEMKNNHIEFQKANEFRNAALADGWIAKPTYAPHEPIESAASLKHSEGYKMMIITRDNIPEYPNAKNRYEIDISIWGSDGLHIDTPPEYNMQMIRNGTKKCDNCKQIVDKTFRYSFAGRCCEQCLPKMREQYEKSGWCD